VGGVRDGEPEGRPFHLADYLDLINWTAREVRDDKRGAIAEGSRSWGLAPYERTPEQILHPDPSPETARPRPPALSPIPRRWAQDPGVAGPEAGAPLPAARAAQGPDAGAPLRTAGQSLPGTALDADPQDPGRAAA